MFARAYVVCCFFDSVLRSKDAEKPERWVVEIEDCLRPWESRKLEPFESERHAWSGAYLWATDMGGKLGGTTTLGPSRDAPSAFFVSSKFGVLHYRLIWRKETEAER
jgi:hypothetical protein